MHDKFAPWSAELQTLQNFKCPAKKINSPANSPNLKKMGSAFPIKRECEDIPADHKFIPFQLARLVLTFLLLVIPLTAGVGRLAMVEMAVMLIALDFFDIISFGAAEARLFDPNFYANAGRSDWYQFSDKLIDQVQNTVALAIMWNWPLLQPRGRKILLAAIMWRWVGVWAVRSDVTSLRLLMFPDVFKELLVLFAFVPNPTMLTITLVILIKVMFEVVQKSIKLQC
jgi:hypothetical protein